jgi:F0F1-type ATP synthase epsilon subunit
VIAPSGKQLDCKTTSVVFPAYDGKVGIWHNHMPMLCELGLGIMEVKSIVSEEDELLEDIFLLIDGGFTLVCSNLLKVVAYDAVCPKYMKLERIEHILERIQKKLAGKAYAAQERMHHIKKAAFLEKLIGMHKTTTRESG